MIGIFDSGVGGLSVLRAIRARLPSPAACSTWATRRTCPTARARWRKCAPFPRPSPASCSSAARRLIVVACNAASAAALHSPARGLPRRRPSWAWNRRSNPPPKAPARGVVGVLATPATFQGALYASVVERFASEVTVLQDTCPGLVAQIEAGDLDGPRTRAILETRPATHAGARDGHGGDGLHPLPLRHPAHPGDRRPRRARHRPGPGGRPPDRTRAGSARAAGRLRRACRNRAVCTSGPPEPFTASAPAPAGWLLPAPHR